MAKQTVLGWILLATVLGGAVATAAPSAHPSAGNTLLDRGEEVAIPPASEPPLILARRDRHERRYDRHERRHYRHDRRQEWRHEARREWRRERRQDAVAAGVGGLIIGGALGAAAASSQRQEYRQDIYNYPSYETDYPYPQY
jgi:hypothetical protein